MKVINESWPVIPRHPSRRLGYVVAKPCRERDDLERRIAEISREGQEALCDLLEAALFESDQVHFVDGEHELADAEQRTDKGVPLGLRQHALTRIDQDHGE